MKVENNMEPEIILVSPVKLDSGPCTPSWCLPNQACNPNTSCNPFNCSPAIRPCMPECSPAPQCNPTQGPPRPRVPK
jgi:hypothetical protein